NYYYWDGAYLRLEAGHWWRAQYLDASWTPCPAEALPGNLRSKPVTRYRGPPRDHRADWDHDRGYGHGRGHGHGHDDDADEQERSDSLLPLGRVALCLAPAAEDPFVVNPTELALDLVEHLVRGRARGLRLGVRCDVGVLARRVPVHGESRAILGDRQLEAVDFVKL